MDIATPAVFRTLRYLRTLEHQGLHPTREELVAFVNTSLPRTALRDAFDVEMHEEMLADGKYYEVVNTVEDYLEKVCWIELTSKGVELTRLGRAMDATLGTGSVLASEPSVVSVVLKGNDPLSYAAFMGAIQRVRAGADVLLVDPYLPSTHLQTLVENAGVTRVLTTDVHVRDAGETSGNRTTTFGLLEGAFADSNLEVRYADKGALHDRLVIPSKGAGLLIGRSLGGRQMTAVVELSENVTTPFREHHELLWDAATPVPRIDLSHVSQSPQPTP